MLQGATKEDHIELFLGLFFSGEFVYPLEDQQGRLPGISPHLGIGPKHLCTFTLQSLAGTASIFRDQLQQGLIP